RHAGEGRGLGHGELVEALAEVGLRRRRDTVRALAEKDDVEIELEDLLLGELVIHVEGDEGFLQLAPPRFIERQEHVAGRLLRDRASALYLAARDQIDDGRARDTDETDAALLEEPVVLRRKESVPHQRR